MSIVVFMLLITTTIVMIPDDLQIKAISGNEQDLYLDGYDLVDRGFSWNKYFNNWNVEGINDIAHLPKRLMEQLK